MQFVGLILLLMWLNFWALFFRAPSHTTPGRKDTTFAITTYAVAATLIVWSAVVWSAQSVASDLVLLLAFACVALGQALMCSARHTLALSNYDMLFSIATRRTKEGVYRYLHNPMYIGLLIALAGTSLAYLDLVGLMILLFVVVPLLGLRAYLEE